MDYEIILQFIFAALWGGIIGAEREYRSKSAGFRTMILISVGACFFTHMSLLIGAPGNADRIASTIITGIGFIGAGVIFRGKTHISGITTAATIWVVAAIGMGIGAGYYLTAAFAGLLIMFVLAILPYIEKIIDQLNQIKTYTISYPKEEVEKTPIENIFLETGLKYSISAQKNKKGYITISYLVEGRASNHKILENKIQSDSAISSFSILQ